MAFSTAVITDLATVIAAAPSAATTANTVNPAGVTVSGGAGGLTNGSGVYASGTYYGGIMDYIGNLKLCQLKAQEIAVLLARVAADCDSGDGQQANIIKVLNVFQ